jgi:hypothetical protein
MDNILFFDILWKNYRGVSVQHKVAIPFATIKNCDVFFKEYYKSEEDTHDKTKVKTKNDTLLKGAVLSANQNILKVRTITLKKLFGFERKVESDRYIKADDILQLSPECDEYKNQVRFWSLPPIWEKKKIGKNGIFYENKNTGRNNVILPILSKLPIIPPPCKNFIPTSDETATSRSELSVWGSNYDVCIYCGNSIQKHKAKKTGGKRSIKNKKIKSSQKRKHSRR